MGADGIGKKNNLGAGEGGEVVRLRVVKNNMGGVFGGFGLFNLHFDTPIVLLPLALREIDYHLMV